MVLGRAASPRAGLQHAKRARTWQPGPGDVKLEQSIAQDVLSATSVASPPWPSVIAESLVPKGFFDEPDPFDELYAMDPEDIHLSYGPCWDFVGHAEYDGCMVSKAQESSAHFSECIREVTGIDDRRAEFKRPMKWASFCTGTWCEGWVPMVGPLTISEDAVVTS